MIALRDSDVTYLPEFISADAVLELLLRLRDETRWRQENVTLFGRTLPQPRLTAWHGDAAAVYRYSGLTLVPQPWTDTLLALRACVEAHCAARFNSVLLNCYRDGRDSIGMHSDAEPELGAEPIIATLSLGATRVLKLEHRTTREKIALPLQDGSLLVMRGSTQRHWRHGIAASRKPLSSRVSLTFRRIITAN